MRTWMKQELKSHNCGPIAVAVIAGVTLEEAIQAIGKKGSTTTKQLARGLRALGYECPNRCKRFIGDRYYGGLKIAKLHDPTRKHGWHWVVIDGFKIFDGLNGNSSGSVMWNDGWKLTSYLPVTKKI